MGARRGCPQKNEIRSAMIEKELATGISNGP